MVIALQEALAVLGVNTAIVMPIVKLVGIQLLALNLGLGHAGLATGLAVVAKTSAIASDNPWQSSS